MYEGQNLPQVQMTIFKVGGMAKKKGFAGPCIGVKVADQNKRNFSDEKLREGQSIIGLQVKGLLVYKLNFLLTYVRG